VSEVAGFGVRFRDGFGLFAAKLRGIGRWIWSVGI
jgi:hypothetical protein